MKKTIKLLAIILAVTILMPFTAVNATSNKVEEALEKLNSADYFKAINGKATYEKDTIEIEYANPDSVISFEIEGNVIKYESGDIADYNYDEAKALINHSEYFKEFIMYTALKLNGYSDDEINNFFETESNNLYYELNGIEILEIGGDHTFTSDNENEGDITTAARSMKIDLEKANLKTSSSDETDIPGTTVEDLVEAIESNSIFQIGNIITFDEDSIEITHTDKTIFTCNDGILTYESGDVTNYDEAASVVQHSLWASILLKYTLEANGYTEDQIKEFFQSEDNDVNFEQNGIEIIEIGGDKTFTKDDETITVAAVSIKIDFEKANIEKVNSEEENKEYKVLKGANQIYKIGEDKNLTFTFDIDYDYFKTYGDVWLDENRVEEDNYTSKSGSTVITFNDEFTNTLSEGEHHLEIALAQGRLGIAKTDFTIKKVSTPSENKTEETIVTPETTETTENIQKSASDTISNPKTGDNITLWISLIVVSMIGIAGTIILHKKN